MWPAPEGTALSGSVLSWPSPLLALGVTAVAGWLWGSFLNLVVSRAPHRPGAAPRAPGAAPPAGITPWRPARSFCFACGRPLPWHDNVPVLSWLWLRGRCRFCAAPIGRRTLVLEAATPLVLVACHGAVLAAGGSPALLAWALAAASWALVAAGLRAERRRAGPGFVATGVLLAVALAVLLAVPPAVLQAAAWTRGAPPALVRAGAAALP